MIRSKIKWFIGGIVLIAIISAVYVYTVIPHPEVVEIIHDPISYGTQNFYSDAVFRNITVIVKNTGASGWVKVTAVYQVDLDRMDEKSQVIYMLAGATSEVQFTRLTGKYIDGSFVWLPSFSGARAEFAWKF